MNFFKIVLVFFFCIIIKSALYSQNLTVYKSTLSVNKATEKLVSIIKEEGLIFFETVNHDKIAADRGVKLAPIRSVLFEDPDLTTTLIACQPTTALDLPLEILVWEEYEEVYIGFIDPKFMRKRFMVLGCDDTIDAMSKLMIRLTNDVLRVD